MGNIVLLDELTINKIAAGEVVDRPSSIVKELVENSIDAGALSITIEIKNGGISYIKIVDDGIGFKPDDTEIAFERHATSKIRQESDILKITSMGFRGEALASIAAVSKVTLITKYKDEAIGRKVEVEAGNILSSSKISSNVGTTLIIKDIFFNTPARFKFLKKDYTESSYIEEVLIKIALANTNISFKYINNNKVILHTLGDNDIKSCIYSIFGKEISENILKVNYELNNIVVEGVIGNSNISRSNRNNEYTYVNSRYVKNKTITSAIETGYEQKLAINKYPFAILNVKVNTETVDVNVHPAKLEVKFENENSVFESVYNAVKNTLEQDNKLKNPFSILRNSFETEKTDNRVKIDIDDFLKEENIEESKIKEEVKVGEIIAKQSKPAFVYEVPEYIEESPIEEQQYLDVAEFKEEKVNYEYLGCIFSTYILISIKDKLYIIDQHAAHERLLYEKFKNMYYSKNKETQMLMIPMIVELKKYEIDLIENNLELFEKVGFVIEKFGDNSYKICGIPNISDMHIDSKTIFLDILDDLNSSNKTEYKEKEARFLYTLACKAAVKGNMSLKRQEHIELIENMLKLENPFTCPHGRPTAYEISKYEIERKFNRK